MRTILVADDDEIFREMVLEILSRAGYGTLAARDGQEAWELLQKTPVDMAVLDLNMPRMDGMELTRRIREDERTRKMPILMLTIRALVEDQLSGLERGADDYVNKMTDPKMLLARLRVLERLLPG